jgi:hypothetical protein
MGYTNRAEVIEIEISEGEAGLLYATSEDLPGLLVAADNLTSVLNEIPGVIKALFAAKHITVDVYPVRRDRLQSGHRNWPWVAVPTHVAAAAMGECT